MTTHYGTIKCFLDNKNFGFITDSSTGKDIFFISQQLMGTLNGMLSKGELEGTSVTYTIGRNHKGAMAKSICFDALAQQRLQDEINKKNQIRAKKAAQKIITPSPEGSSQNKSSNALSKVALKDKLSTVGRRMFILDNPRLIEVGKVRLNNFVLISVYKSKIGLSKVLDYIVNGLDFAGSFLQKRVVALSNTKKPKLKRL